MGAVHFKTITVFLFLKFDRHPFFIDLSAISFAKRQINHKQNTTMLFLIFKVNLSTSLHSLYQNDGMLPKFVLRDSALSARPSVHRSVRHTLHFLGFSGLWPHCCYPNDQVTSNTAPDHPHATGPCSLRK